MTGQGTQEQEHRQPEQDRKTVRRVPCLPLNRDSIEHTGNLYSRIDTDRTPADREQDR